MTGVYSICPHCREILYLTKHHVFPKRHFSRQKRPLIVFFCRECHDELEEMIPFERQEKGWYLDLVYAFISVEQEESQSLAA